MDFDKTNKVIIDSMNEAEASAFILFLVSEIARHEKDIQQARELANKVREKFGLWNIGLV